MSPQACLIRGNLELVPVLTACKDFFLRTAFVVDYARCTTCGLVQQTPIPGSTEAFYRDYPIHVPKGRGYALARSLLIRGVYFEPEVSDAQATLLDFGCGDGSFLQTLQGKVAHCLGFEPSRDQAMAVSIRLGLPVASDVSDAVTVPSGTVDIVTAHFVLEHLTDLRGTFAYWSRILKQGGKVRLAVPELDCFEARLFGRRWHGLDAPRHISFPSGGSLERLANQQGFRLIRRRSAIFPNTWGASIVAALLGRHHQGLFLALTPLAFVLSLLLPQSTAIYELHKEG